MAKAEILEIKGPIKRSMIADNIELFEIKKRLNGTLKLDIFNKILYSVIL